MQARMKNPAVVLPETTKAVQDLLKVTRECGVPETTMELVHLRASQINGCSFCVDYGARGARKAGVTDDQLNTVAAWREVPYFDDAERAALALTEYATRLSARTRCRTTSGTRQPSTTTSAGSPASS